MVDYKLSMTETLAIAVVLLILGRFIKKSVPVLERFFIPAPVIGGTIFSIISLIGYEKKLFVFAFDSSLKDLLMVAFFTTVGFLASFRLLKKGGVKVLSFLLAAIILVILQNILGVSLAKVFGLNSLLGLAAGSIPLTGGHGTSGAFGPDLEDLGVIGATSVAIASATFGLVAGCLIGGPIGKKLMKKYDLHGPKEDDVLKEDIKEGEPASEVMELSETTLFQAIVYIVIAMGVGSFIPPLVKKMGVTLPAYIGPMLIAAIMRNIKDGQNKEIPLHAINVVGNISLQLFLAMTLMSMRLWELASLAGPLVAILLAQTVLMALFAYFVTFKIMGKDYDAVVLSVGHCGFGMGATPNAMANMESFTAANGPSTLAFFALPLVGSLFIDFFNASIITIFINIFGPGA